MLLRWIVAFTLSVIIGFGSWASWHIYQFYQPNKGEIKSSDYITIKKNATLNQICKQLQKIGMVEHPKLLSLWLRLIGADRVQAGVYQYAGQGAVMLFMEDLNKGRAVQMPFVVLAGQTWAATEKHMLAIPWLENDLANSTVVQIGHTDTLDGLLLADTYYFTAGSKASGLVERANAHLNKTLNKYWRSRERSLPYQTSYELLIAASIIEKETALEEEKLLISRVIVNRLQKKMRLQMDPTIIYALGKRYNGTLSRDDLQIESPYNTYLNHGLPPTPISMVSESSIAAAAHPAPGDYLYFVATGDGHHYFSSNYQQHQQAVKRYVLRSA